jgi:hypothetical protein
MKKKTSPKVETHQLAIRLTPSELAILRKQAGLVPLARYIRMCVFGKDHEHRKIGH